MSEKKQYINGVWANEKTFNDGGSIIKLSILPDKFIDSVKSVKPNEDGFIKLVISKSQNPKENSSHYIYVDTWAPAQSKNNQSPAKSAPKVSKKAAPADQEEEMI